MTSDPTTFFPRGYYVEVVNLTLMRSGISVVVGTTPIRLEIPGNLEVKSTASNGTTTVITMTVDYQCGTSIGGRIFFEAQLADNSGYSLSYCLLLNTAIATPGWNSTASWNLWQVSKGVTPTLALHMVGRGENVNVIELWVGK